MEDRNLEVKVEARVAVKIVALRKTVEVKALDPRKMVELNIIMMFIISRRESVLENLKKKKNCLVFS